MLKSFVVEPFAWAWDPKRHVQYRRADGRFVRCLQFGMSRPKFTTPPKLLLRRPLPIPTFDEFVLLHKAIMGAISSDPTVLHALHGARRSFGWNMLGNLLDLGKIIFAPATSEVLRCAHQQTL